MGDPDSRVLHNLAALCEMSHRVDQAEQHDTQALRLWEPLLQRDPNNTRLLENVSHLYQNLAFVHERRREWDGAERSNAEVLRLRERLAKIGTKDVRTMVLLADIQQNIGGSHARRGTSMKPRNG